jgi:hypothetical protein
VRDLARVLPGEGRLEPGRAALGEQRRDGRGQEVVRLVDEQRQLAPVRALEPLLALQRAVDELHHELPHQARVVLAGLALGAVHDQDLAALDDPVDVELVRVAQRDIDAGDQARELVLRRVEPRRRKALVGDQCRELLLPVLVDEAVLGPPLELVDDVLAVVRRRAEHLVDVLTVASLPSTAATA